MEMIQSELNKKGIKIIVIGEPEETQAPTVKGEAYKAWKVDKLPFWYFWHHFESVLVEP